VRARADAPAWVGVAEPDGEPGQAAQAGGSTPAPALDGLLALQESLGHPAPDWLEADRPARQHGRRLLVTLGGLQRLMLTGGDAGSLLAELRSLAEAAPEAADPALAAALGAINLRVRVELARRGP